MTGYASVQRAANPNQGSTIGLELRAVNSRFLDVAFKIPDEWRGFESSLRQLLGKSLQRGKVELRGFCRLDQGPRAPSAQQLAELAALQQHVQAALPQAAPLSVAQALSLTTSPSPWVPTEPALLDLTQEALQQLQSARASEGARLARVVQQHMAHLHALAAQAQAELPQALQAQRERLAQRMAEALTHAGPEGQSLGHERVLVEATAYAIKVDVAEELNRLQAHLQAMHEALQRPGPHGKRLDFLVQELHREANTLGAKAANMALSRLAMEMKITIEQIREQVQNIE